MESLRGLSLAVENFKVAVANGVDGVRRSLRCLIEERVASELLKLENGKIGRIFVYRRVILKYERVKER